MSRPLIVHVLFRFDVGGLENGVVNLINHMPPQLYRHAVVALTEVTSFRSRVQRDDVEFVALHKPPGHAFGLYPRLYRLFKTWRPAVVHTRNLAALEVAMPAWAAGVPVRIHGEHGRDVDDLDGLSRKHQWIRRAYRPFVQHHVALSRDLAGYLEHRVGVAPRHISQIYNGVDAARFRPAPQRQPISGCPFQAPSQWLVGTVGRMQAVKDQLLLAEAFVQALRDEPGLRSRLRLVMIGDGPLRRAAQELLQAQGVADLAWLPGERNDVADIMRGLDCFVLPSRAEGVSNTILEAMASGLPVIATEVGGNAELVDAGRSGALVPARDAHAMAGRLRELASAPEQAAEWGREGRRLVEQRFSLEAMVDRYRQLYDSRLKVAGLGQRQL